MLDVIISGFFDSIGIYQQVPEAIRLKAMQWLARLNLTHLAKKAISFTFLGTATFIAHYSCDGEISTCFDFR